MNRKQIILLAVALLAGLLAAYLSMNLVQQAPAPAPVVQKPPTTEILVATRAIDRGVKLENFAAEWRSWPADGVTPEMITREQQPDAAEEVKEARARLPLVIGEPITAAKIVRPGERGFLTAILPKGRRGLAVPISEASAVSGFIVPNDRVDVLLTRQATTQDGQKFSVTSTILRNVKVLAINQTLKPGSDGATVPDGRNAVLELDPQQTEVMLRAITSGSLSLALRSLAEGGEEGFDFDTPVLDKSLRSNQRTAPGTLIIRYGFPRNEGR